MEGRGGKGKGVRDSEQDERAVRRGGEGMGLGVCHILSPRASLISSSSQVSCCRTVGAGSHPSGSGFTTQVESSSAL